VKYLLILLSLGFIGTAAYGYSVPNESTEVEITFQGCNSLAPTSEDETARVTVSRNQDGDWMISGSAPNGCHFQLITPGFV